MLKPIAEKVIARTMLMLACRKILLSIVNFSASNKSEMFIIQKRSVITAVKIMPSKKVLRFLNSNLKNGVPPKIANKGVVIKESNISLYNIFFSLNNLNMRSFNKAQSCESPLREKTLKASFNNTYC